MAIAINAEPRSYGSRTSITEFFGAPETGRSDYLRHNPQLSEVQEELLKRAGKEPVELWNCYTKAAAHRLDKAAALQALEELKALPPDWSVYNVNPINRQVLHAAMEFIWAVPSDIAATPKVVPMTRGRLQFEWHRGNRSLELEFENSHKLHYLKWDSDAGIEEEDVISVGDTGRIHALLRWFSSESQHV